MYNETTVFYHDEKGTQKRRLFPRFLGKACLFILYVVVTYLSYPIRILAMIITIMSIADVILCMIFFRNIEMIVGMTIIGLIAVAINCIISTFVIFLGDQLGVVN